MTSLVRQRGLTLVELMIASTLSMVLLGGVLLVFSANKVTYRLQNGLGTLQENGRYAVRQIAADLQTAGFGGCQSPRLDPRILNVAQASPPATDYLNKYVSGEFFDGLNDQLASVEYGGVNVVAGSDAIEIRGPLRAEVAFADGAVLKNAPINLQRDDLEFATGDYLLIGDCSGATVFRATGVTVDDANDRTTVLHAASGNVSDELAQPYGVDAVVTKLAEHTYFVGTTTRANDSGQTVSALYRFDGSNAVELVDGVENMQIDYALDTDGDGVIDAFRDAGGITEWRDVMAVRISLLMNSVEQAAADEADYTYYPAGSTAISPPSGDYRLRQEFSSLISIRNSVL